MKLMWALGLVCLSILVDVEAQTKVDLTYIKGAAAKGAFCLDGSVPAYHLDRGYGSGANNWVIHLQGGGWCTTKEACINRTRGDLGSSKQLQPITFTGILSNKSEENPDFFNWNRVVVRYCDGASFSGDSQDEASGLYFRGQRVWLVAMEALMSQGMRNAKQALLTGCSAGGLATIIHCDEFRELFPNITTVKCLSDAGLFLDVIDISGGRFLRDDFEAVISLQGVQKNLPHGCTAKKDPTSCFFPQNLIDNIRTPLFLVNPLYDAWQVNNALIPISADPQGKWNACKSYYANCSSSQKQILEDFGNQMVNAVSSFSRSKKNGLYMNSCFAHCQTDAEGSQSNWFFPNSPRIGNMSIAESVGDWYFDCVTANVHIDQPKPFGTNCHNEGFKALAPNSPI